MLLVDPVVLYFSTRIHCPEAIEQLFSHLIGCKKIIKTKPHDFYCSEECVSALRDHRCFLKIESVNNRLLHFPVEAQSFSCNKSNLYYADFNESSLA